MNAADPDPSTCPLCGRPNHCSQCKSNPDAAPCWCAEIVIPAELIAQVPAASRDRACICRRCVEAFHQAARRKRTPGPARAGEYYFENGKMVFTREYHLRRGFCCGNQCRHCPYGILKR